MRQPIFSGPIPVSLQFKTSPEDPAKLRVLDDVNTFVAYSQQLKDRTELIPLVEMTLGYMLLELPKIKTGREIYQLRLAIKKANPGPVGEMWYEQFGNFQEIIRNSRGWFHLGRALWQMVNMPDSSIGATAERFMVSEDELTQLVNWYHLRAKKFYGEAIDGSSWWGPDCCDEEDRFRAIYPELRKHANMKLASPSFSYLSDLYEDRNALIDQLIAAQGWYSVLITAHRPQVESLKMAKQNINTGIHHLAVEYTSHGKQQWNETTKTYEVMELGLLSNQEMDESKHACLAEEDHGFEEVLLRADLEAHLNPREYQLVRVLGGMATHEAFENFAQSRPDRRLAAFEFFGIDMAELKVALLPLLQQAM